MPIFYEPGGLLHHDDLTDLRRWHHEGVGELTPAPGGGMRLRCHGSRQGREGCMAFFRPTLPDQVCVEYNLTLRATGGLVINYLALRGSAGEDLLDDRDKLPQRTGVMKDYWGAAWGLQSYHVSICRFNDRGEHTGTSNWRRNPGGALVGHGEDLVTRIGQTFRIRLTKDGGACQLHVDGRFAHGFVDWATQHGPIPDHGKFGFRLIGADVMADVSDFRVHRLGARNPHSLAFEPPWSAPTE